MPPLRAPPFAALGDVFLPAALRAAPFGADFVVFFFLANAHVLQSPALLSEVVAVRYSLREDLAYTTDYAH